MKNEKNNKPGVTGVGGIFFKTPDPEAIKKWYSENLGFKTDEYGTLFRFCEENDPEKIGYLQWSPMKDDTDYFNPSRKQFMVNYRVNNLEVLLKQLKENGVRVLDEIEEYEYGKFVHILDPDGNKIELWEPVVGAF